MSVPCKNIYESPLSTVQHCHDGEQSIDMNRLFSDVDFKAPCHFIDYAVLSPNSSIGRHQHGNNEEIYLILEGSGCMTMDEHVFPVKAGDVIVNKAGGVHSLINDSNACLKIFVVEIECIEKNEASLQ